MTLHAPPTPGKERIVTSDLPARKTAEELRAELERTRDLDARATLIRAICALQTAGEWDGEIPPLRPSLPRRWPDPARPRIPWPGES